MKNINLGATFLFLSILCSIKIERLLFLKFLKFLAFFDSYFWLFNKSHEKIKSIFVINAIIPSVWNVFIKFRWNDEKLTRVISCTSICRKAGATLYCNLYCGAVLWLGWYIHYIIFVAPVFQQTVVRKFTWSKWNNLN